MAYNRRNQSGALRLVPALKAVVFCMVISGLGIGYVVQKNKIHQLGREIMKREAALERLKWDNKVRSDQLAALTLPQNLAERVKEMRLGLMSPQAGQVVWLPEPLAEYQQTNQAGQHLAYRR